MSADMLVFGAPIPGYDYVRRPGAYGLAWRDDGKLLLVETCDGLEIPGGGVESDESLETALAREFLEETGYRLATIDPLLSLRQYLTQPAAGKFYDKLCTFFRVQLTPGREPPYESGHRPLWLDPGDAAGRMAEECQEWLLGLLHTQWGSPEAFAAWPHAAGHALK